MKIKNLLAGLFLLLPFSSFCQQHALDSFNAKKLQLNKRGMTFLMGWGAANIAYGAIARSGANGTDKYFHEMNMIWGGINLGLSALGFIGSRKQQTLDAAGTIKSQSAIEKTFLFNTALDVAYIAGGFYLKEKSKNNTTNPARLKGYGNSIVLQGAALTLFDGVMYFVHNQHGKQLFGNKFKWQLASTGNGLGLLVKW